MDIPSLVDIVNKNAFLIQELIAEEIDLVDIDGSTTAVRDPCTYTPVAMLHRDS